MIRTHITLLILVAGLTSLAGCEAGYHSRKVANADQDRLTLGTAQRELRVGMPASGVAEVLGAPNIVSTDEQGREVWIYDKTATEVVASGSSWFVTAGAARRTQRTLTVIVKMDEQQRVRDVAYHSSSF